MQRTYPELFLFPSKAFWSRAIMHYALKDKKQFRKISACISEISKLRMRYEQGKQNKTKKDFLFALRKVLAVKELILSYISKPTKFLRYVCAESSPWTLLLNFFKHYFALELALIFGDILLFALQATAKSYFEHRAKCKKKKKKANKFIFGCIHLLSTGCLASFPLALFIRHSFSLHR